MPLLLFSRNTLRTVESGIVERTCRIFLRSSVPRPQKSRGEGTGFPGARGESRPPGAGRLRDGADSGSRGCGVCSVSGWLGRRRATGIWGKATLLSIGASGAVAPRVLRTKCQSHPRPRGHVHTRPGLNTMGGAGGTIQVRAQTPCAQLL